MRVFIDASLFTETDSIGHVSGDMQLPFVPQVGDRVALGHDDSHVAARLIGKLTVEHRGISADSSRKPTLSLSDIIVKTKQEAFQVARYLENHVGLFVDIHSEDDLREYKRGAG